jgi:hypothetical protein
VRDVAEEKNHAEIIPTQCMHCNCADEMPEELTAFRTRAGWNRAELGRRRGTSWWDDPRAFLNCNYHRYIRKLGKFIDNLEWRVLLPQFLKSTISIKRDRVFVANRYRVCSQRSRCGRRLPVVE